jgi:hypothetical protein
MHKDRNRENDSRSSSRQDVDFQNFDFRFRDENMLPAPGRGEFGERLKKERRKIREFDDGTSLRRERDDSFDERANARQRLSELKNQGFRCVDSTCRSWIPLHDHMGTHNRNHCPCCLSSKHVDEKTGDRNSDCGARMDAIALSTKKEADNLYASKSEFGAYGELMLVHCCSGCGHLRINRLAADDNSFSVLNLFNRSLAMSDEQTSLLTKAGITPLTKNDAPFVLRQLDI